MAAIQPLANVGVRALARTGIDPLAVVSVHGLLGFAAALLIATGSEPQWLLAALFLQFKTLLDNIDGGLARTTGHVTQMGRYYDTVIDLAVNVALFAALARHGPTGLALLAFVALTVMLSLDHNLERLYRDQRKPPPSGPATTSIGAPAGLFALFRGVYRLLLAPQDRGIERLDRWLFARLYHAPLTDAPLEYRLAWSDLFSTATLVNLGLSSPMLALGVSLVLGRPFWYVLLVLAQLGYVVCVQILRVVRFRRYLRI
jgi:phosphatidylglycerophosphate synthase